MSCFQSTTNEFILANLGVAADEPAWSAVQTRPRHEKKVSVELQEKGVSAAFRSLVSATRQWSGRHRVVEMSLFPQYVLVRIAHTVKARISVLRTNGITNFGGTRGIGIPIPADQIERIQTVVALGVPVTPHAFFNLGRRIRIRGAALDGLQGILNEVNGDQSLVVSVALIQRSLAVRIAGFAVEPA